jgi:hypothetical protein
MFRLNVLVGLGKDGGWGLQWGSISHIANLRIRGFSIRGFTYRRFTAARKKIGKFKK